MRPDTQRIFSVDETKIKSEMISFQLNQRRSEAYKLRQSNFFGINLCCSKRYNGKGNERSVSREIDLVSSPFQIWQSYIAQSSTV